MTASIDWLGERLGGRGKPIVIDGGMGTQLERLGAPMDARVWSARALITHPDIVRAAHAAFIDAGAEVIITNTFAAGRHMLEPAGLGDRVAEVNRRAVALAIEARDRAAQAAAGQPVAIAGSICEWTSADDPEWHNAAAIRASVREQAALLADAGVDLIALEMCQHVEFSCAAAEAALETGLPLWLGVSARRFEGRDSVSVFDHAERPFEPLVEALAGYPAMLMNVMHTPVPDVAPALEIARRHWSGPLGVYPESGYFAMPNWQFVDIIEPADLAAAARGWIDGGVRLVGGCCGLGPEHIAALVTAAR